MKEIKVVIASEPLLRAMEKRQKETGESFAVLAQLALAQMFGLKYVEIRKAGRPKAVQEAEF